MARVTRRRPKRVSVPPVTFSQFGSNSLKNLPPIALPRERPEQLLIPRAQEHGEK